MKPQVFFFQLALFASHAGAGGWDKCTVAGLTNSCSLFENLTAKDRLVTEDGFTIPACALNSVSEKPIIEFNEELKRHAGTLTTLLAASPGGPVHPVVLADWINQGTLWKFYVKNTGTFEFKIPLSAAPDKQTVKLVERADFEKELDAQLGSEIARKVREEILRHVGSISKSLRKISVEKYHVDEKARERRERIFEGAKEAAIRYLRAGRSESQLSEVEKGLVAKIEAAKLKPLIHEIVECGEMTSASYLFEPNEVNLPANYLFLPDSNIMYTFLHELAHSIDFCRFKGSIDDHPFKEIGRCLLADRASGAFQRDKRRGLENAELRSCSERHLEGFCDWFATEVTVNEHSRGIKSHSPTAALKPVLPSQGGRNVQLKKGLQNILGALDLGCETESATDTHPAGGARANEILLLKPEIRRMVGCDPVSSDPGCRLPPNSPIRASPDPASATR